MCGIAGIWYDIEQNEGRLVITNMTDAIVHRGPDGEGHTVLDDGYLFLGHRRLSIIDLSDGGIQPMEYLSRYTITYNGEIYNYLEIRDVLKTKGYSFKTATDTEVLMAAYDFWGVDCLKQFDGMFAFALFDLKKQELFCARDRFGEKPFHYYSDNNVLAFASEMKSLWAAGIDRTVDDYSMYLFINMDLHEDPADKTRTFYKDIKRLQPGHYFLMKKHDKQVTQKRYWSLEEINRTLQISFKEACVRFDELFRTSVQRRLRSDVSVGTSLSGGLDSSAIAIVMNQFRPSGTIHKCFSARFNDPILDEGYFMKMAISNTDIEHIETWPNAGNMVHDFEKLMFHQEEPFGSASIFAQWEVFKLAKQNNVTVLLDGQGADEVLAGYTHFFAPFFRELYINRGLSELEANNKQYLLNNEIKNPLNIGRLFRLESRNPIFFNTLRSVKRLVNGVTAVPEISNELYSAYKNIKAPFTIFNDLNSALKYSTTVSGLDKLLRFADRNSMAHSREVRLPFLSHELVEFVFGLPADYKIHNGWTKALLRHGLSDILPPEIAWRRNKLGFQPPQKQWEKESSFTNYMKHCRHSAVSAGYLSPKSDLNWKSFMVGAFLDLAKKEH